MCEGAAQVCELGVRDAGVAATVIICAYISYTMCMYTHTHTHACTYMYMYMHMEVERSGVACCVYTTRKKSDAYASTRYQGPGIQRLLKLGNLEQEWSEYGRGYIGTLINSIVFLFSSF